MLLGFVSAILPDLSLEDVLDFAASEGYDCVELMCWPPGKAERRYAGVTHLDVTALDVDHVKGLIAKTGVEITRSATTPMRSRRIRPKPPRRSSTSAGHRRRGEAGRRDEHVIGRDWTKSVDDNWPRFLETWRPIIAHADEKGVKVGIENCPMLFSADEWPGGKNLASLARHMAAHVRRHPEPQLWAQLRSVALGLMQMDPVEPLWEFAERIHHAHAKDVRVDRRKLDDVGVLAFPLAYHTPKLPGMGDVDWGRYFSVLTDVGYDGPVCVEVEDRAYEGTLKGARPRCARAARTCGSTSQSRRGNARTLT
ncbi:MAG: sugar phosphate isomerase/epimerase [Bryobacterales bacterium]